MSVPLKPPNDNRRRPGDDPASGLTTTLTRRPGRHALPRLVVTGFVDVSNATEFRSAVKHATADQQVLLDLTRAEFVSSAAISVLFEHRDRFAAVLVGSDGIVAVALAAGGFPTIPA